MKKVFLFAIAFILMFTLVACGPNSANKFLAIQPITPWVLYTGHLGFGTVLTLALYSAKKNPSKTKFLSMI